MPQGYFTVDFSEIEHFISLLDNAAKRDFKKDINEFLEGVGIEFLRIISDEIIRKQVVDTRLLLASFNRGSQDNIWIAKEGNMTLEVGTNVEYAGYANDGHWTCKAGEIGRFVPGVWSGGRFIYQKGAKTGMYLKQQWVEGSHFWESSILIMDRMFPQLMDEMLEDWLKKYFADLL